MDRSPRRLRRPAAVIAGLLLLGGIGLGVDKMASDGSSSTPGITTPQGGNKPTSIEAVPGTTLPQPTTPETQVGNLPKDLILPNSNDPSQLASALYSNYQNYVNTGNMDYLDYEIVSNDGALGSEAATARQNLADYQNAAHSGAHYTFSAEVQGNPVFTNQDTQRIMTINFEAKEYLDTGGAPYKIFTGTRQLTLTEVTRYPDPENQANSVNVWLISEMQDLSDSQTTPQ